MQSVVWLMQWFHAPFLVMNPFGNLTEAMDVSLPENYPYIHQLGYNFREFLYTLKPMDPKVAPPWSNVQ